MPDVPPAADQDVAIDAQPFFLIGAERSGTTLLRLMLDHHPDIRCQFESSFYVDYLRADGSEPPLEELQAKLAMDRVARLAGFTLAEGQGFREEAIAFLRRDAQGAGKRVYGATIHRRFPDILRVWPEARFVNLVRDPRDVAPSVIAMGWAGNTWYGSRLWVEAQEEVHALAQLIPADRLHTLRFEDLVSEPVEVLTRLAEFLGTSFHEGMLSYPEDTTYPPPDASAAARWKNKLSTREVQLVEACAGDWLEAVGYAPAGHPPLGVGGARRAWLKLQNRLAKIRFRVDRYGFPTVFAHALHRRLGNHAKSQALLLKMQARDNELLR